ALDEQDWAWVVGEPLNGVEQQPKCRSTMAEANLARPRGIRQDPARGIIGGADGPEVEKVPLKPEWSSNIKATAGPAYRARAGLAAAGLGASQLRGRAGDCKLGVCCEPEVQIGIVRGVRVPRGQWPHGGLRAESGVASTARAFEGLPIHACSDPFVCVSEWVGE
ncbi:unnamed protein product, partial [Prorocentrum cordatum]